MQDKTTNNEMRRKNMLADFDKIKKLWIYLYADLNHKIEVENSIGAVLELSMDPNGYMRARIVKSVICAGNEQRRDFNYDEMLSIPVWLGIIEQLERAPAEGPGEFKSRWEEIMFQAAVVTTLNKT